MFIELLSSFGMQATINEPTRIGPKSATLLDNIFLRKDMPFKSLVIKTGLSDHLGQELQLQITPKRHQIERKRIRNLTAQAIIEIREHLQNMDWTGIYQENNPNKSVYLLNANLIKIYNEICPEKVITISCIKNPPWLTNEIRNKCHIKRQLYEGVLDKRIPNEFYRNYCKYLDDLIEKRKKDTNTNYILRADNKAKATWNLVSTITQKTGKKGFDIKQLCDHHRASPEQMLNRMNEYYINIVEMNNRTQLCTNHIKFNEKSMILYETSPSEIFNVINSLNDTMSVGADKLPTKLIKACADLLCLPLSSIINSCFKRGIFPDHFKVTLVRPIFKKGDAKEIENYRPIALIPVLAKIMEKTILTRMVQFADFCNILTTRQNAYVQGRSTTRAIYMTISRITELLSNKMKVAGVFLDLSKAFDSVDHDILLQKLERMGFRGLINNLLESYLKNRLQCITAEYDGTEAQSNWLGKECGVPQGSILGPFLFLLYTNDLPEISDHFINMFADDTSIIIAEDNETSLGEAVVDTINSVNDWFTKNNLKLNVDKTNLVKFSLQRSQQLFISFTNIHLVSSEHTTFLGLVLDDVLSWKEQINVLAKTISRMVYGLRIISSHVHIEAALSAYHAYVMSRLSYGIIFWGNSVEANRIFVLQKSCIRSIFNLKRRETCRNVFTKYELLTLPGLYIYECACFARKHYNDLLVSYETSHEYMTRECIKASLRIPQTTFAKIHKSVVTQILKVYNYIPCQYKETSLGLFKYKMKKTLTSHCLYDINEFFHIDFDV